MPSWAWRRARLAATSSRWAWRLALLAKARARDCSRLRPCTRPPPLSWIGVGRLKGGAGLAWLVESAPRGAALGVSREAGRRGVAFSTFGAGSRSGGIRASRALSWASSWFQLRSSLAVPGSVALPCGLGPITGARAWARPGVAAKGPGQIGASPIGARPIGPNPMAMKSRLIARMDPAGAAPSSLLDGISLKIGRLAIQ